ncbi:MAG TPA: DUF402 domain-containing protein [Bacilli bacterium]|nr:DUF402 domain-containing protein [Bacilli bacterium]
MKRKTADREGWKRILKRSYAQEYLDNDAFTGHIGLLQLHKVAEPLQIDMAGRRFAIADNGQMWLHQVPDGAHHVVTTMFDAEGRITQWYVDICLRIGLSEAGVPWFDDLFLDLVAFPDGEVVVKDTDELQAALDAGTITQAEYDLAWTEANRLLAAIKNREFTLFKLSHVHKDILIEKMLTTD